MANPKGRPVGSKNKLTKLELEDLKPRLYELALAILADANAKKARPSDRVRAFDVLAPYIVAKAVPPTSDGAGLNVDELRAIAKAFSSQVVHDPGSGVESPTGEGVQGEQDEVSADSRRETELQDGAGEEKACC